MSASQAHELTHTELEESLASIEIPPCPQTVTSVLSEAQKDAPDLKVLARTISSDVGMSAYAIKLANSTLFRRGPATDNVLQAIARLGTRNLVCIVVAVALRNSMASDMPPAFLDRFWNRSNSMAMAAGTVARKLRGIPADLAYTFGLFHDSAIPVMLRRFKDYAEVLEEAKTGRDLTEAENARYHCSHAVVGALLARNWGLPKELVDAIRFHHDTSIYASDVIAPESLSLIAVSHVAEQLIAELNLVPDPELCPVHARSVAYLGLHEEDLMDLKEELAAALS